MTTTETTDETKINTYCDVCDNQDFDTKNALVSTGWELSPNYQLCPNCAIG
jgi:hypothetical protein